MNGFNFTVIIPYKHQSSDRLNLLRKTIDWYNAFSGSQVVLVEMDTHSKIKNLNLMCEHIFAYTDKPFNRSWGFNIGLKYSKTNIIVFGDSDIVMEPQQFISSLKLISEYDVVSPYTTIVDLKMEENNYPFQEILKISRKGRGEEDNQKINIAGGIVIFRKESIDKIGGWPEEFIGWGGEDDFTAIKIKEFLNWKEVHGRAFHFWHEKQKINNEYYKHNLNLLNKAANMDRKQLTNVINHSRSKIGLLNKYE